MLHPSRILCDLPRTFLQAAFFAVPPCRDRETLPAPGCRCNHVMYLSLYGGSGGLFYLIGINCANRLWALAVVLSSPFPLEVGVCTWFWGTRGSVLLSYRLKFQAGPTALLRRVMAMAQLWLRTSPPLWDCTVAVASGCWAQCPL